MVRAHGRLAPIEGSEAPGTDDTERVLAEMLDEGSDYGMRTFDQALLEHARRGG